MKHVCCSAGSFIHNTQISSKKSPSYWQSCLHLSKLNFFIMSQSALSLPLPFAANLFDFYVWLTFEREFVVEEICDFDLRNLWLYAVTVCSTIVNICKRICFVFLLRTYINFIDRQGTGISWIRHRRVYIYTLIYILIHIYSKGQKCSRIYVIIAPLLFH